MELKDESGKVIAKVTACDCNEPAHNGVDEGVWVEIQADDGTRPTLCIVKRNPVHSRNPKESGANWYLGVYRDTKAKGTMACDLAISFGGDGPKLQVTKGGKVKTVDLFDLVSHLDEHPV